MVARHLQPLPVAFRTTLPCVCGAGCGRLSVTVGCHGACLSPAVCSPLPVAFHTTLPWVCGAGIRVVMWAARCLRRVQDLAAEGLAVQDQANREYPSLPLLLLWLTIDRVACGQICFGVGLFELVPAKWVESQYVLAVRFASGFGHVELVPAARVELQYANPLCLEGSLRPHGDLVSAGRIESRCANHLRCLGGQLSSCRARSGALLDNAPATVSLRLTGAAAA